MRLHTNVNPQWDSAAAVSSFSLRLFLRDILHLPDDAEAGKAAKSFSGPLPPARRPKLIPVEV
jgi:hypothetical protein